MFVIVLFLFLRINITVIFFRFNLIQTCLLDKKLPLSTVIDVACEKYSISLGITHGVVW